jgi:ectoine hydroxylase-related dioxygenase (phytanoyl-CoA dioxygenase family)
MTAVSVDGQPTDTRSQFDDNGFVILRNVLDGDLVSEARQHVEWLLERHPETRPENLDTGLMTNDPFWVRLVSDPRLLDIAEQFIGPDIALFASHYVAKPPFDGQPVLWHQDGSYWPLEPMNVVSLWLAVDASTPDNGCMRVVPGSHQLGLQQVVERSDVENVLGSAMDDEHVDEQSAVDLILQAGDVSIHHPNIIHGSNANTSANWRRGLTIRYIPTSTRVLPRADRPPVTPLLMRGQAVPGVNEYAPWPAYQPGEHMHFRGAESWTGTRPAGAESWTGARPE